MPPQCHSSEKNLAAEDQTKAGGKALGEYVGQFIGDYSLQVGVALFVLAGLTAAWIISRRRLYVKSAEFKRGIDALRLEFRRSIDETRAATTRKATAVIKPIDASVADLNVRLGRLEERADSAEAFMAGSQTNALQETDHIAAHLRKVEQNLNALSDQISLIEQTIDGASRRDRERNNSIDVRITSTEKRIGDLFPRIELGEKARADLGALIGLFVKQLKRVNMTSAETAVRVGELENLRAKLTRLEERLSSTANHESQRPGENFISNDNADVVDDTPNQGEEVRVIETNNGSEMRSAEVTRDQPILNASCFSPADA
jgi:chromosome segregation ATPase